MRKTVPPVRHCLDQHPTQQQVWLGLFHDWRQILKQASSQGRCGGCDAPFPNLPIGPLWTTKWVKNEVIVGGLRGGWGSKSPLFGGPAPPPPPPPPKSILATGLFLSIVTDQEENSSTSPALFGSASNTAAGFGLGGFMIGGRFLMCTSLLNSWPTCFCEMKKYKWNTNILVKEYYVMQ